MRLLSFEVQQGRSYGLLADPRSIVELGRGQVRDAPDLKSFLALTHVQRANAVASAMANARATIPLDSIGFLPVIPDPEKIFCVGSNYHGHRVEAGRAVSGHPPIFLRLASSLTGHDTPIHLSPLSEQLDYEGELAVVIGKPGRYIREENAPGHVAGYCCFNDGSFRDWQQHTHQISPGKNFPGTGALGPHLVTPDEIQDLGALRLQTRLNGTVMQSASIAEMIFTIEQIIAYVSGFTPLAVGDVIATGTPGGVGFTRKPPVFMKEGDSVEVEIDTVGLLRNRVGPAM